MANNFFFKFVCQHFKKVWEQGADEKIWTQGRKSNRRMEKTSRNIIKVIQSKMK
jgi:hypothetical protein